MTYQETIDYLYQQLPMFSRIGAAAYKKDLHNTLALLEALGNPHQQFKSLHIAGTNGKGSTSHMLAAVMQANGYKTGLYTSPHLKDFRERIKVNGEWVAADFVVGFTEKMKPFIKQIQPSFFELTVAMAFEWFAQQQVDVAVIETGMGGRLDSTNVLQPVISIITNIGYDHMNLLGNSLQEIAFEKAGIIKPHTPVVIGETNDITKPLFVKKADETGSKIIFAEEVFQIESYDYQVDTIEINYQNNDCSFSYTTDLSGIYQQFNLRTTLAAIDELKLLGWNLDESKNRYALQHVKQLTGLGGRWEVLQHNPYVILDVAHNEDGIRQIMHHLSNTAPQSDVRFVIGMAKDKEVEKVLALFPTNTSYYFTNAHIPRAMPVDELQQKASAFGLNGDGYDDVNDAIAAAIKNSNNEDLIIVCGSVFVVGEVDMELVRS